MRSLVRDATPVSPWRSSHREPALNLAINNTAHCGELLNVLDHWKDGSGFTVVNLSTAAFKFGRLVRATSQPPNRAVVERFLTTVTKLLDRKDMKDGMNGRAVSSLVYGYSRGDVKMSALARKLGSLIVAHAGTMNQQVRYCLVVLNDCYRRCPRAMVL